MVSKPGKSKIALAMIVKGSEKPEHLDRCLSTVAKWVDGIFITITTEDEGVGDAARKYGAFVDVEPDKFWRTADKEATDWLKGSLGYDSVVQEGDKLFQFDEARNHNFAQVPEEYGWVLWMDVDDVLRKGEALRGVVESAEAQNAESVFFNYIYQAVIVDGKIQSILIQHLRERLIINKPGVYKWIAPIHETLIEQRPTHKISTRECEVLHLTNNKRMSSAIDRNIKTLEYNLYEKEAKDPRTIYYLGKAYFDLKTEEYYKRSLGLFKKYLFGSEEYEHTNKSGWAEERAQCWELSAEVYRVLGQHDHAIMAGYHALREDVKFPSTYLSLALSYLIKGDYFSALHWVKIATQVPPPQSTLVSNPRDLKARALEVTYVCSINLNMANEAYAAAAGLADLFPESPEMADRVRFAQSIINERELTKSVKMLANHLEVTGEGSKLKPLLASVPATTGKNPFIAELYRRVFPPRKWSGDEIAIFCGPGFTAWSPRSLKGVEGSFVGGSEEAVIYAAKELNDLGWKVTVYGEPGGDEGLHDGVNYLPYYRHNKDDEFNILIAWRNTALADAGFKCKKMYLWNHDIQNPLQYTDERVEKFEKIFFLSPWHRENVPDLPDEKVFITGNGITL